MARGVDGRSVFIDDEDRHVFLRLALRIKLETPYSLISYCLMGNHFHFAVRVRETPLSRIMHRLLTAYVLIFNGRHTRQGHLFQARYKSVLCLNERYLLSLIRYIHMNPVRAGLTATPDAWAWSSHRQYVKRMNSPLVDTDASERLLHSTSEEISAPDDDFNPWPLNEEKTAGALIRDEKAQTKSIDSIAVGLFNSSAAIAELKSGGRRRVLTESKRRLALESLRNGHTSVEIARWMGCGKSAVNYLLQNQNI